MVELDRTSSHSYLVGNGEAGESRIDEIETSGREMFVKLTLIVLCL